MLRHCQPFTELWIADPNPSLQTLTQYQEQGSSLFPVDSATDCRDFFELATGERSVPQDKLQRLYVLAFKEARATGRIRFLMLTPTEFMLADGLTKVMNPPKLFQFLSTGYVEFGNATKHPTLMRRLPVLHELQEEDLFKDDASLWKEAYEGRPKVSMQKTAMLAMLGLAAKPVTRTLLAMTALTSQVHAATSEALETSWGDSWSFPFFILLTFILLRTLEYLVTCLCRVAMKSMSPPKEAMPTSLNSPTATPMTRRMSTTPERFMPSPGMERTLNLEETTPVSAIGREPEARSRGTNRVPEKIWITTTGACFHLRPDCNGLNHGKPFSKKICIHCMNHEGRTQSSSGVEIS